MDSPQVFSDEELERISFEFRRLNSLIYLDHAGSCLYPSSLIEAVAEDLRSSVYSNPHSNSTCSHATSDIIDQVRFRILQHFNTDQSEYSVIFTSGATAALKLVAEAFDWACCKDTLSEWHPSVSGDENEKEKGVFVYLNDSHTSVLGMRNIAEENGICCTCLSHDEVFAAFENDSEDVSNSNEEAKTNSLFVYPAQCNFSGFKYPLNWIEKTRGGCLSSLLNRRKSKWYCLLDAATFLSTNCLDLSIYQPDFVCLSFYKIFGYPTGLGGLLVKNSSANVLLKKYYGGGTVLIALSSKNLFVPRPLLHDKFENGTLNFLSIISLQHCFKMFDELIGNMERVSRHCFILAKYAFESLLKLHHSNGAPAVKLYSNSCYEDESIQGGIVAFNLLRSNGDYYGYVEVLHQANLHDIQLRTGCFCNSGACSRHLTLSLEDVKSQYNAGHVCGDDMDLVYGRPTGAVRISFGYYSTFSHVDKFLLMVNKCFVEQPATCKLPNDWTARSLTNQKSQQFSEPLLKKPDFTTKEHTPNKELVADFLELENFVKKFGKTISEILNEPVLTDIFLYPVKSCGALWVPSWTLDSKGLLYDRMWMIVNSSGVALTQKREPKLCLIRPNIDLVKTKLTLSFEGQSFSVPLDPDNTSKEWAGSLCQSKVCGDRIEGLDCGDEVALWLSQALGSPGLRLIRHQSRTSKKSSLSLANLGQYLLVSRTSVSWLCDQISTTEIKKDGFIDRFRSNLVVQNIPEPFIEQTWSKVTIGDLVFKVDGGCNRCHMICIDQSTGVSNQEPLTALGNAMKGKLKFGIYLSRLTGDTVSIKIGDTVTVQ